MLFSICSVISCASMWYGRSWIARWFAVVGLRMIGWKDVSKSAEPAWISLPKRYVVFGEPHTHMLDFLFMQMFFLVWRVKNVKIPVNKKFFVGPIGWACRFLGGVPVDTRQRHGVVNSLVEWFDTDERRVLHISPSSTRSYSPSWKSGFYHIALSANVPVVPAFLDAKTKTYGWGSPFKLTGDKSKDMDHFRAFYKDKRGFSPDKESVIMLKCEQQE